jgi:hypothetical protein
MLEVTDSPAIYCHRITHYYMYEGEYHFYISTISIHEVLSNIQPVLHVIPDIRLCHSFYFKNLYLLDASLIHMFLRYFSGHIMQQEVRLRSYIGLDYACYLTHYNVQNNCYKQ